MILLLFLFTFLTVTQHCCKCTDEYEYVTIKWNNDNSSVASDFKGPNEKDVKKFIQHTNYSNEATTSKVMHENVTDEEKFPWTPDYPEKELPFAIIVAGPTAAFIVIVFLCVAFYFHNLQLNKKAQKLYMATDINSGVGEDGTIRSSALPIVTTNGTASPKNVRIIRNISDQSLCFARDDSIQALRESSNPNMWLSRDSEVFYMPKKSAISLGLPSRGSTLSAFADQEIVNQSAKRKHSMFFL